MLKKEAYAPLWKRIIAYIIDLAIVNIVIIIPFKPVLDKITLKNGDFLTFYNFYVNNPEYTSTLFLISFFIALFMLIYWTVLEFTLQQSIGKIVFNLKVISENKKLNLWQCLVRNISKINTILIIIDSLFIFKSIKNQRLLEKLAKTYVVE